MLLPVSDKQASYRKPHIKKGYYPAQLLKVVPYNDKEGRPIEGTYGRQLIWEYAIYKPDQETGKPLEPMQFADDDMKEKKEKQDVIIAKFVYHEYKNADGYRTAVTPNSAITNILKAHGWVFTTEGVDPDKFIGTWVEVNIDDYEVKATPSEKAYTASTIKDIGAYKGPKPDEKLRLITPREPKEVRKETSQKTIEKRRDAQAFGPGIVKTEVEKIQAKMDEIKDLKDKNFLTEDGYNQAMVKLNEELKKAQEIRKK